MVYVNLCVYVFYVVKKKLNWNKNEKGKTKCLPGWFGI